MYALFPAIMTFALNFLVSRVALRVGVFPATLGGLVQAHAAAAGVIVAADAALKYGANGFNPGMIVPVVIGQALWLFFDRQCGRLPAVQG